MSVSILGYIGLAAVLFVISAVCVSALLYRGKSNERFSLLNHFISELGELGVSRAARLFNTALICAGLLLLPMIVGLALSFNSLPGWLGMLAGIVASLALTGVGVFPMNSLEAHSKAATTYFRAGLGMVVLFGLAVLFQPAERREIPTWSSLFSLLAALCYASFIFLSNPKYAAQNELDVIDLVSEKERPRFWLLPAVEWAIFFATILWLLVMALLV